MAGGQILGNFEGAFSRKNLGVCTGGCKILRASEPNFRPFGGSNWGFSDVLRGIKSKYSNSKQRGVNLQVPVKFWIPVTGG